MQQLTINEFFEIIFSKSKRNKNVQNLLCYSVGQPLKNFMDESDVLPLHIIISWLDGSKSNYKKYLRAFDTELFINYLATDEYFRTNCTDIYYALKDAAPDYFPDDRADFDSILEDICTLFKDIVGIEDEDEEDDAAYAEGISDDEEYVSSGNKKVLYNTIGVLVAVVIVAAVVFIAAKSLNSYDNIDRAKYATTVFSTTVVSSDGEITSATTTSEVTTATGTTLSTTTTKATTTKKAPSTKPVTKKPTTTQKPATAAPTSPPETAPPTAPPEVTTAKPTEPPPQTEPPVE